MDTAKPTIVLVDDSAAMRAFFEQVAAEADFALHVYDSAEASLDFLAERGFTCITFDDDERDAMCANVTITRRGKSAIGFAGAPRVNAEIESHGISITTVSGETLALGNGGPHCMTCPVLVV